MQIGTGPVALSLFLPAYKKVCNRCAHPYFSERCTAHKEELETLDGTLAIGLYLADSTKGYLNRFRGTKILEEILRLSGYAPIPELGMTIEPNIMLEYQILRLKNSVLPAYILGGAIAYALELQNVFKKFSFGVEDVSCITFVPEISKYMKKDEVSGKRYEPSEALATVVSELTGVHFSRNILVKKKPLIMKGLSELERYEKALKSYSVTPEGRDLIETGCDKILIVDDVRTTGATGNALATKLKEAGAKKVYLAVAGRNVYVGTFRSIIT